MTTPPTALDAVLASASAVFCDGYRHAPGDPTPEDFDAATHELAALKADAELGRLIREADAGTGNLELIISHTGSCYHSDVPHICTCGADDKWVAIRNVLDTANVH